MNEPPAQLVPPVGPESLAIVDGPGAGPRQPVDRDVPRALRAWLHPQGRGARNAQRHDAARRVGRDRSEVVGGEETVSGQYGPTADYGDDEPDQQLEEGPAGYPGLVPDGRSG